MAPRVYTDLQQRFLDALFTEEAKGNLRKAMAIAGYKRHTPTRDVVDPLHEEIAELTKKFIARSGATAAYTLFSVLDGTDDDPLGRKDKVGVAKDLLDRAGFAKTDKVEVTVPQSIFLLPPKEDSDESLETS